MKKIALDDILGFAAYEKVRQQFRDDIIDKKKRRRVAVGDKISIVFENRDTVIFQIQEMLRAERIADLDKIREFIRAARAAEKAMKPLASPARTSDGSAPKS